MFTVGALAALVDGVVIGDATREIRDVADLASAGPTHIAFLANPKYAARAQRTAAGAVLVQRPIDGLAATQVVCKNPYLAMARIAAELHPPRRFAPGVERGAHVHDGASVDASATVRVGAVVEAGARVGARSVVGAGAYVGHDAVLGADCLLHPGARVLERCVLGDRVILHAGAVVGSDGFGYAPDASGRRHKIPQLGIVVLEDDVELGANTTVDRATFGVTRVGAGTKLDNLVQVAHNVVTGRDCVAAAQSGIAGSATLGARVVMGAQTGVAGHLTVGDDITLAGRAGVASTLTEPGVYSGLPAVPHRQWLKAAVALPELPELRRRIRELERRAGVTRQVTKVEE